MTVPEPSVSKVLGGTAPAGIKETQLKIFITGGTGFIGSAVVDLLLEQGHAIHLLSRKRELPAVWTGREVTPVQGDLQNADSVIIGMQEMDAVIHLGEIRNSTAARAAVNTRLVESMAGQLKQTGAKRFVFVSSLSVAGIPLAVPATEGTPAATVLRDHYTEYKRNAEEIVRRSGTEHVILRPGIVYGPGSRHLGRLIQVVRRFGPFGLPFIGSGRNLMPLIHVEDLAQAICRAATEPDAVDQTLNITDGERHTWMDFFSAIADAQDRRLRLISVPPSIAKVPALFFDLFTGVFGQSFDLPSFIDYLSRDVHFTVARAQEALAWTPERTDLWAAVRGMVASYAGTRR